MLTKIILINYLGGKMINKEDFEFIGVDTAKGKDMTGYVKIGLNGKITQCSKKEVNNIIGKAVSSDE